LGPVIVAGCPVWVLAAAVLVVAEVLRDRYHAGRLEKPGAVAARWRMATGEDVAESEQNAVEPPSVRVDLAGVEGEQPAEGEEALTRSVRNDSRERAQLVMSTRGLVSSGYKYCVGEAAAAEGVEAGRSPLMNLAPGET
jgi:hypothetical protein